MGWRIGNEITEEREVDKYQSVDEIVWTDDLSVGIKKIDDQNMELITIINKLLFCQNYKNQYRLSSEILTSCLKYRKKYFREEILLLGKLNYPNLDLLNKEQQNFLWQIAMFCQRVVEYDKNIIEDLALFLTNEHKNQCIKIDKIKQIIEPAVNC